MSRPYKFVEDAEKFIAKGEQCVYSVSNLLGLEGIQITPHLDAANVFRRSYKLHNMSPMEVGRAAEIQLPFFDMMAGGPTGSHTAAIALSKELTINSFESGLIWVPEKLLQADPRLLGFLESNLMYCKEKGLENAIVSDLLEDTDIEGEVATATTNGFTYDNLVDLDESLPEKYQSAKCILLSPAAYKTGRKLVVDGQPALRRDPVYRDVAEFNGTPVLRCSGFEGFGSEKVIGAVFSLFGFGLVDLGAKTQGVGVAGTRLGRFESSARLGQAGFNLFGGHTYGWDPEAIVKFVTPAS